MWEKEELPTDRGPRMAFDTSLVGGVPQAWGGKPASGFMKFRFRCEFRWLANDRRWKTRPREFANDFGAALLGQTGETGETGQTGEVVMSSKQRIFSHRNLLCFRGLSLRNGFFLEATPALPLTG